MSATRVLNLGPHAGGALGVTPATLAVLLPETCHPSFGLCFLPYDKRGPRQQRLLQGCRDRGGGTRGPCDPGSARWPRPDPMAPPPARRPRCPLTLGLAVHAVGVPSDVPYGLQGHRLTLARQPGLDTRGDTQGRDVRTRRETCASAECVRGNTNGSRAKAGRGRLRTTAPLLRSLGKGPADGQ